MDNLRIPSIIIAPQNDNFKNIYCFEETYISLRGSGTKKDDFIYNNIMENVAYNDYQIFSPQVMEQLARAYFENQKQSEREWGEVDGVLAELNALYCELEKRTFQKQKIILLKKIINNNVQNMSENIKNNPKKLQIFNNLSQNYLIRKIIQTELQIIKQTHASPELSNEHIKNVETLITLF